MLSYGSNCHIAAAIILRTTTDFEGIKGEQTVGSEG